MKLSHLHTPKYQTSTESQL